MERYARVAIYTKQWKANFRPRPSFSNSRHLQSPEMSSPQFTHTPNTMAKHAGSHASSISEVKIKEKKKPIPSGPPAGVSQQAPLELSKWRFVAVFLALMMSVFLFALGQSFFFFEALR